MDRWRGLCLAQHFVSCACRSSDSHTSLVERGVLEGCTRGGGSSSITPAALLHLQVHDRPHGLGWQPGPGAGSARSRRPAARVGAARAAGRAGIQAADTSSSSRRRCGPRAFASRGSSSAPAAQPAGCAVQPGALVAADKQQQPLPAPGGVHGRGGHRQRGAWHACGCAMPVLHALWLAAHALVAPHTHAAPAAATPAAAAAASLQPTGHPRHAAAIPAAHAELQHC